MLLGIIPFFFFFYNPEKFINIKLIRVYSISSAYAYKYNPFFPVNMFNIHARIQLTHVSGNRGVYKQALLLKFRSHQPGGYADLGSGYMLNFGIHLHQPSLYLVTQSTN